MKTAPLSLISSSAVAAGAALLAFSVPAQAASVGSIDIVGQSVFGEEAVSFLPGLVIDSEGVFSALEGQSVTVASVSFDDLLPTSEFFILGEGLSFTVTPPPVESELDLTPPFLSAFAAYQGTWTVGTVTLPGTVVFSAQKIGNASSYSISGEAVPEPLTLLGSSTALAFGIFFKSQSSRKKKSKI